MSFKVSDGHPIFDFTKSPDIKAYEKFLADNYESYKMPESTPDNPVAQTAQMAKKLNVNLSNLSKTNSKAK